MNYQRFYKSLTFILVFLLTFTFPTMVRGVEGMNTNANVGDTIAQDSALLHPDEDFVRAYVVVASPGTVMYSALGHACLRLQCDTHGLDYIYSYEGESSQDNILRFFAGNLMMGCRAIPTQEYLKEYADAGRGVDAYELNLPIAVKQRLWQQMDDRLVSSDVPYDYMNRGCAISVSHWIRDAIDCDSLVFGSWPVSYTCSRKEMGFNALKSEWIKFILSTFTTGEAEYTDLPYEEKITVPVELVEVLQNAQAYGRPLLSKESVELLPKTCEIENAFISPLMVAILLLLISMANVYFHCRYIRWVFWTFQFLVALFITYLVVFSSLPCTQWNWLLIPFNPLPVLLWRWRNYWLLPFMAICALWIIGLLIYPHQILVSAHYVLVLSLMASMIEMKLHK